MLYTRPIKSDLRSKKMSITRTFWNTRRGEFVRESINRPSNLAKKPGKVNNVQAKKGRLEFCRSFDAEPNRTEVTPVRALTQSPHRTSLLPDHNQRHLIFIVR